MPPVSLDAANPVHAPRASASAPVAPVADRRQHIIWEVVSLRPLHSLWDLQGVPIRVIVRRTWNSLLNDNLFGAAAELGYWFLFALFPTLVSASSILGLAAKSAAANYDSLIHYMSLVIPPSAFTIVLETFNQITAAANGKKVTLGLAAALWAASVGFSAIQDSMNTVYKVKESRPYWKVRGSAVIISTLLSLLITAILGTLLLSDLLGRVMALHIYHQFLARAVNFAVQALGRIVATGLTVLLFAVIYYFAPDVKQRRWRWLSPGAAIGILGWALSSLGLRVYLHFYNSYNATYGSLGAVIILLTWFYLTGLMLLLGGEVNSEIEAAATEKHLAEHLATLPPAQLAGIASSGPSTVVGDVTSPAA